MKIISKKDRRKAPIIAQASVESLQAGILPARPRRERGKPAMDIASICVSPVEPLHNVIKVINQSNNGFALVTDENGRLKGTITDGDIRRHILACMPLDQPCQVVMSREPIIARSDMPQERIHDLIRATRVRILPVVDCEGRPVRVAHLADLLDPEPEVVAVVMAGGEGRRLRPITENLPKPMIEVGGKPLLERIVLNLKRSGFEKVFISVNYRAEMIEEYFGDGSRFGVEVEYLRETTKLGTAGSISMLQEQLAGPVLVINGDVMTRVNLDRFVEFHRSHRCAMSVAAMGYHLTIPYGVISLAGHYVTGIEEKPTHRYMCNAGIYILEPEVVHMIPSNASYDMTQLMHAVSERGLPISVFPIHEYWVDVGRHEDLERARQDCWPDGDMAREGNS